MSRKSLSATENKWQELCVVYVDTVKGKYVFQELKKKKVEKLDKVVLYYQGIYEYEFLNGVLVMKWACQIFTK